MDALVLLPGFMCDARVFDGQIAALSARVTLILPVVQGDSPGQVTDRLLAQLPQRFALAGQGLGGVVAMDLLRRAPERVTRIALIATTPLAESAATAADREARIVAARSGRLAEAIRTDYPPEALASGPGRARVVARLTEMALALGPDAYVMQSRLMQRRRDSQDLLRRIRQPALVLCGAQDGLTPVKRHQMMAEMIPAAHLTVLPGAGHLPSIEAPDAMTEALTAWMAAPLLLR